MAARQVTIADFDRDGDLDIFVAKFAGSRLLLNEQGRLRILPAADLGLPEVARCANWVDYDNDGLVDCTCCRAGCSGRGWTVVSRDRPARGRGPGHRVLQLVRRRRRRRSRLAGGASGPARAARAHPQADRQLLGRSAERAIAHNPVLFFIEGVLWGHPFGEHLPWRLTLYENRAADQHWLRCCWSGRAATARRSARGSPSRPQRAARSSR